jgi:hypothetical protein
MRGPSRPRESCTDRPVEHTDDPDRGMSDRGHRPGRAGRESLSGRHERIPGLGVCRRPQQRIARSTGREPTNTDASRERGGDILDRRCAAVWAGMPTSAPDGPVCAPDRTPPGGEPRASCLRLSAGAPASGLPGRRRRS